MVPVIVVFAAALVVAGGGLLGRTRRLPPQKRSQPRERAAGQILASARIDAQQTISAARMEALTLRQEALDEAATRRSALETLEFAIAERERAGRERRQIYDERRHAHKKRRAELDEQQAALAGTRLEVAAMVATVAGLDRSQAGTLVLDRIQAELDTEHDARVERAVAARVADAAQSAGSVIAGAIERQDTSHADGAPRPSPVALEGLDESARERLLTALATLAETTGTDLGVDPERNQATLRGTNPLGREVARQASLELVDRHLQVADVGPLVLRTRRSLNRRIIDLGERALWEMEMGGRPELAELVGTLHYRFSFGQNALLHCQETGYICSVLAAELGLEAAVARQAGMLHDIGKAVDHDVEGSHAIIGGEILRLFGTAAPIVHAVKAHHFDEEPETDLALLTICADAVSASRPGARRDTLATYLARLDQLQQIATRHAGVERAFPLQAGREVRVIVKSKSVKDAGVADLSNAIARDIEAEMTYPGMIKVTVIRESTSIATAPAQVVAVPRLKKQPATPDPPHGAGAPNGTESSSPC